LIFIDTLVRRDMRKDSDDVLKILFQILDAARFEPGGFLGREIGFPTVNGGYPVVILDRASPQKKAPKLRERTE
jgi:hypothetical protein